MSSISASKSTNADKERKPYIAPAYTLLTPAAAKRVLLEHANVNDPEVMSMLQRIAELEEQNR